jgi:hypothetical protein
VGVNIGWVKTTFYFIFRWFLFYFLSGSIYSYETFPSEYLRVPESEIFTAFNEISEKSKEINTAWKRIEAAKKKERKRNKE